MRSPDGLLAGLGQSEILDLAFLNQLPDRARHVFDRHVWVHAMLVEQVDVVAPEPLERCLDNRFDVLWATVETPPLTGNRVNIETELGCDHHLVAQGSKRFADQLFVGERAVDLGSIEESYATLHGRPNNGDHVLSVAGRAIVRAHAHAA